MLQYQIDTHIDQIDDNTIQETLPLMPANLQEATLKMRFTQGRREKVASYLLLCKMLREHNLYHQQPQFDYTEHGKPFLANYPHLHFNLSHCKNAVAVMVSTESSVGIDIECDRHIEDGLIRYTMSPIEQQHIFQQSNPAMAFLERWTQKEPYLKYLSTGIDRDLRTIPDPESLRLQDIITETKSLNNGYVSVCYHR